MTTTKVNSEFIAVNAISGTIIADGAITSTHLAVNSVDSSELVTGSIDTIHIAANQVTATKIVTNGVLTRHISDDQVTADKLANSINTDIATGPAALPKAGGTMTGNITSNESTFSLINNDIRFKTSGAETMLRAVTNGAVELMYDNSTKIATESGGVHITGYADADNFKIAGAQGSDGQLLTSTGSGVAWEDAPAGGPTFKTFGTSSIMIGDSTTGTIDAANYNTGVGVDVFAALTTGDDNVAVGFGAAGALTTGVRNVFVGEEAGSIGTTTSYSVGIGRESLKNATGNNNTGVGYVALKGLTSGTENTAVGRSAMTGVVTGTYNSVLGYGAGGAITSGSSNVAIGGVALDAITTSSNNTAVGHEALTNASSGQGNTAIGKATMTAVVTGSNNTAVGIYALNANTSASNNVAVGVNALVTNNTGATNTAVGGETLYSNTTGNQNIAIGHQALYSNTTTSNNYAIGYQALMANTGTENVAMGLLSGRYQTGSNYNTFYGSRAGYATTSSENVIIGGYGGSSNTSSYHHVLIGYNVQSNHASNSNTENVIGHGVTGIGSGYNTLGGNANRTYNQQGSASWSGTSDQRLKTDVVNEPLGLSFINDLRPIKFKWKKKKDVDSSTFPTIYEEGSDERVQPSEHGVDKHGFLAQELESTIANYSDAGDAGHEIFKQTTDGIYTASPSALIPMLVKAIQELSAKVKVLEG